MALIPLIIDSRVPYVPHQARPLSLLALPLGENTVLGHLAHLLAGEDVSLNHVIVMPQFAVTAEYRSLLGDWGSTAQIVVAEEIADAVGTICEDSDSLLIVEPRQWPLAGYRPATILRQAREYRGVTHVVHLDAEATRELVEQDASGQVKRIRRYYNLVHWPEAARTSIAYSLVPVPAIKGIVFRSLAELRMLLSARGLLSRDLPLGSGLIDLGRERGFLTLHEKVMADLGEDRPVPGMHPQAPGVLACSGCRISPAASIIGPVILQANVVVEAGAVVVGPSLIGQESVIRGGAMVVQSVLLPGTDVGPEATVRHRVASGRCQGLTAGHESLAEAAEEISNEDLMDADQSSAAPLEPASEASTRRHRIHAAIKRGMDATLSALALVVLSPLMLFVAALIKLDSSGPIFFVHRRERRGGKDFPCLKFRTMTQGAHLQQRQLYAQSQVDGPQFKMNDDPRVTRLGHWLRATNIDELPQLINVLVGHMSLVGPRPSPFRENQICVPWRLARLSVRPGITGLWQVCRQDDRSRGDFHEWIYYDIAYVRHFSIWLDLKIFVATIATLGGRWSVPLSWLTRNPLQWRPAPIQPSPL